MGKLGELLGIGTAEYFEAKLWFSMDNASVSNQFGNELFMDVATLFNVDTDLVFSCDFDFSFDSIATATIVTYIGTGKK